MFVGMNNGLAMHGWSERTYHKVIDTNDFKERLFYILEDKGIIKCGISQFMEMIEKETFIN